MGRILKKLNILLDKTQKRAMGGLVVLMVISAGLQTLGVGMILSVVQTVMDREAFHKPGLLHQAYLLLGGGSELRFSVLVMLGLVLVYVVKNLFLFFEQRATLAFVYSNQFRTSERMMRNYLRRSYEFYLNADTAVIQRNITANVNNMYALILALLQLVSDCIVFAFLVAFLLVQDAGMTILLATVMILLLALIKCVLKPVLQKVAGQHQDCYSGLLKWISQTVQGVKEIKIACKEQYFVDEYLKYGNGYVGAARKNDLYSQTPKLLIETVCVACMIGYVIYMMTNGVSSAAMVTTLTAFAAAAIALLPCVNRINNQMNKIAFCEPFLMAVSDDLQQEISGENVDMSYATDTDEKLPVRERIDLRGIVYAYPGTEKKIFDHADLTIPVGRSVGIVGTSGAGKSTVVDILLENKLGMAKSMGIDVSCSLILPCPCMVRDIDFCVILANALDNAIHACKLSARCTEPYIHVSGRIQGDFILLEIENSFQGNGLFRTGTGISNIRAVAEKYQGTMRIKAQGTICVCSVLLLIPQYPENIPQKTG